MLLEDRVEVGKAELELDELDDTDNDVETSTDDVEVNTDDVVEISAFGTVVLEAEPDSVGEKVMSGELVDAGVDTNNIAESSVFEETVTEDSVVCIADNRFDELGKVDVFSELKEKAVFPPTAVE
jgi:hypothetical protein